RPIITARRHGAAPRLARHDSATIATQQAPPRYRPSRPHGDRNTQRYSLKSDDDGAASRTVSATRPSPASEPSVANAATPHATPSRPNPRLTKTSAPSANPTPAHASAIRSVIEN